jgi:hypothetical protein
MNRDKFWDTLAGRVTAARESNKNPLMIFDLDGTLIEHHYRIYHIFAELAGELNFPEYVKAIIFDSNPEEYEYDPKTTLRNIGLDEEYIEKMFRPWLSYFLSNRFLTYDRPIQGAYYFVRNIISLGIKVIYLTGRDVPNMGEGTRTWLRKFNFLDNSGLTELKMKTDLSISNAESKKIACDEIKASGQAVLVVDNEPKELEFMLGVFPESVGVLMDTPNSGMPGKLPWDTLTIKHFDELNSIYSRLL